MSIQQFGQPALGFALNDGEVILRNEEERGHIEVAWRILNEYKWMKYKFDISSWAPDNPVDFLIYEEGAAKIGNRWGETRIIQYYPYVMSKKIEEVLEEYRSRNYDIREVYPPQGVDLFFHR